mmetsp:Transcript_141396/g.368211  ORF Transcript_141396/g.368211 Transcript_141396/m.368211 type:complete len:280 (+) Transcript_141396:72-911(+)
MHFGAFVSTTEGSAVLSCVSNHHTTKFALPASAPSNFRSARVGTSLTSALPSSSDMNSAGFVSTRKSPSPLSRSTPSHKVSEFLSGGQTGQKASISVPASCGNRTSQSTPSSRSLAGITGAPLLQSSFLAYRMSWIKFSPKPDASMSSDTSTSNFLASGTRVTPRTSVHHTSSGASSAGLSGAVGGVSGPRRFAFTISSEARAMELMNSTPTTAEAPARSAIMERIPSPLPTSRTRHAAASPPTARSFDASISARIAFSYKSWRAPSRSISKYQSDSAM